MKQIIFKPYLLHVIINQKTIIEQPLQMGEIDKAIKATACAITKSRLSDKIHLEVLLQKAGLKCLNEAVACYCMEIKTIHGSPWTASLSRKNKLQVYKVHHI